MRTFLFILLLANFASCGKKANEINSYRSSSSFTSEKALIIPHAESGSIIRAKLLNKIVETSFPSDAPNPDHIIQIHDELNNFEFSESELKEYEIKEKLLTKVVVSFSDREEVYFVQERIPVNNLISILNLNSEGDRKLKLISSPHSLSFFGATFYIVSLNHEDLMLNDRNFHNEEFSTNNFQESIYVKNFKKFLIKVNYDFKVQALEPVIYTAPSVRCNKELLESGECGRGCSFTANLPANRFEKVVTTNLLDLGLVVKTGDAIMGLNQLPIINSKDGHFEIELDSSMIKNEKLPFQLLRISSPTYSGSSAHYNFSSCNSGDKTKVSPYTLSTQVNMNYSVSVFGRGEDLKIIQL